MREDDSEDGDAWNFFPHDHARSRASRSGEDGLASFSDAKQRLCVALALWHGHAPILKERLCGLTNAAGHHGEDVTESSFYLDCVIGLLVVSVGGSKAWTLPIALAVSVLASSSLVRRHVRWRQAPITTAIVIAGERTHHATVPAMAAGVRKGGEVRRGGVVGVAVTWLISTIGPRPEAQKDAGGATL